MSTTPVSLSRRGAAAILTIERPDRLNSLSRDTLLTLGQLARQAIADQDVRAIVVTGTGDKAFCAGADLKERQGMDENAVRLQLGLYRDEMGVLDRSPKPVIAALNGVAQRLHRSWDIGWGNERCVSLINQVATPRKIKP